MTETTMEEQPLDSSRKRLNSIILLVVAAIVLNALYSQVASSKYSTSEILKVGDVFPDFSVKLIDGTTLTSADNKGKPAIYFFYANWCPCSHYSIDFIKMAYKDYLKDGLQILAAGIQDSSSGLKKFVKTHQLKFPVTVKDGDKLARMVGVKTTPTTFFVGADGHLRSVFVGKFKKYSDMKEGLSAIFPASSTNSSDERG